MEAIRNARRRRDLSQRELATRAGLSFRGYQLLEKPGHNPRLESIEKAAAALDLPIAGPRAVLSGFLSTPPASIRMAGYRILSDGPASWTVHLFDFVDAFRREPSPELVEQPPPSAVAERLKALIAGTAEALCREAAVHEPPWCQAVPALTGPWFVSGVENLKASAIAESPLPFRRRNVFVLGNFLARA